MKSRTIASIIASLCISTHSPAAIIVCPSVPITVSSGQSLHMNWTPGSGWFTEIGSHTGGEPLYLTPTTFMFDPDMGMMSNPADVGSWSGTALSLSKTYSVFDSAIDGDLEYSNYLDLFPNGDSNYYSGLRYDLGGGDYCYGWVNYVTNADSSSITLEGAAFNTIANEPIRAGQLTDASPVPEPASLFSTVCLAASALVLRRRSGLSSPTISTPVEI